MENVEVVRTPEPRRERSRRKAVIGGAAVESLAGVGAVVLSIIGLTGRLVTPLAAIAVLAAGAALLFEAAAAGAAEESEYGYGAAEGETEKVAVRGGIGADSIAGLAAIALGILALIGIAPLTLLPVAAIVLGAGLLLSAGLSVNERNVDLAGRRDLTNFRRATSGVHVLVGAGAAILGILGVLGNSPLMLTLIATLSIGAAQLLTGASIGAPVARIARHET